MGLSVFEVFARDGQPQPAGEIPIVRYDVRAVRRAAKTLSQAGMSIQAARQPLHDRLRAERDAGMVCGKLAR